MDIDQLPVDIPLATMMAFRKSCGATTFYCRYEDCSQATNGFATTIDREKHEAVHISRLQCEVPYCAWQGLGFRRARDLKAHKRRYHPSFVELDIPPLSQKPLIATGIDESSPPRPGTPVTPDASRRNTEWKFPQLDDDAMFGKHLRNYDPAQRPPGTYDPVRGTYSID